MDKVTRDGRRKSFYALLTHSTVDLNCDGDKLNCRSIQKDGTGCFTWWVNGEDTGLQSTEFVNKLKESHYCIDVINKQF